MGMSESWDNSNFRILNGTAPELDVGGLFLCVFGEGEVLSMEFKKLKIKAAPWDDINFRFYFRTEVVYPTDHVFIFFRIFIFLQVFLINISMEPEVTQTNYLYT